MHCFIHIGIQLTKWERMQSTTPSPPILKSINLHDFIYFSLQRQRIWQISIGIIQLSLQVFACVCVCDGCVWMLPITVKSNDLFSPLDSNSFVVSRVLSFSIVVQFSLFVNIHPHLSTLCELVSFTMSYSIQLNALFQTQHYDAYINWSIVGTCKNKCESYTNNKVRILQC